MTIANDTLINVQNLVDYTVSYTVPESNMKRTFMPLQQRQIEAGELRSVYSGNGGQDLFTNYLAVKNAELASEFNITDDVFEHEYNWTVKDVNTLLLYGSLDGLKDALEFGPDGIKDLIIDRAIELRLPDTNKINIISEFTGKDVMNMINLTKQLEVPVEQKQKANSRRVAEETTSANTKRRVSE